MMIGGTPKSATPAPLIAPTAAPAVRMTGMAQMSGWSWPPAISVIRMAAQFKHPGHRQVDAAADDDEGLAEGDDADEGGKHRHRAKVRSGEEARRHQAGQKEKHDHAEIGEQDGAMASEEGAHARLRRADFSASELASTATSRITPETIGCQ